MAEDKIRSDELIEKDIFNNTAESAIKAFEAVEKFTAALIGTSQAASTLLNIMPKTLKEFKEQNAAIREIEKTVTALAKAEKIRSDILKSVNIKEEQLQAKREQLAAQRLQSEQKVTDAINKTAATEKIANEKVRQEIEKTNAVRQRAIQTEIAAKQKLDTEALKQLLIEQKLEQQKNATVLSAMKVEAAAKKEAAAAAKAAEQAKRQNDAYGKLNRRHQELVRDAQNLAVAFGQDSKQAKEATLQANKLDAQLKKIDASLGRSQREVGNYGNAWKGVAQGFQNFLGNFGISIGIGAVVGGLKDSIEAFVEAEKNARALEFAVKNVGNEGTLAFKKLIEQSEQLQATGGVFSDDEIQKAQTQLVNYGLLSNEVEELMPKILDLATAQGVDLSTATETVIKGINGQTKGLKSVGLGFEDTGSKAKNYELVLQGLNKFQGAAADAATTTEGRYKVLQNRFDDFKEDIGGFLVESGYQFLNYWDLLTGKITAADYAQKSFNENSKRHASNAAQKFLDAISDKSTHDQIKILNRNIYDLSLRAISLNKQYKDGVIDVTEYNKKHTETIVLMQELQKIVGDLEQQEKTPVKPLDERIGIGDKTKDKADEWVYTWEMAIADVNKAAEDAQADEDKRHKARLAQAKHEADLKKAQLKEIADENERLQKVIDRARATSYDITESSEKKRQDAIDKQERKRIADLDTLHDKGVISEEKYQEEITKVQEDADRQRLMIQFDKIAKQEELISQATFDGLNKRFDIQEKELQNQGDVIDTELDRQSQRQLAGLDNTYAEQQRLKADNQAKLAELDAKRRRAEQAKELADLFIEFTKAYAKEGDINAAQKALAQAVAVKAIADTIAGSFYEGTEDTGTVKKPLDSKGGRLAILHDRERVVPERLNRMLDGMSNDDLVERALMFNDIFNPQMAAALNADEVKTMKRGEPDWMGSAVLNQLVSLEKTVRDKPEQSSGYSETEKAMVTTLKSMGITKIIVHKRF